MENNKTLQEFKKEVAIAYNLKSWSDVLFAVMNGIISARKFDSISEEAAERYANHKAAIAWEEGYASYFIEANNPYKQKENG